MNSAARFLFTTSILITVSILVVNCSSENPAEPEGGSSGLDTIVVSSSAAQSRPAALIPLAGLPPGTDNIYGIVTQPGNLTDTGFTLALHTDSGAYLISPLNPANLVYGGQVHVTLTDDSSFVSEPLLLTIDSLPEAPGEFESIVTLLRSILSNQLRINRLTRDSLDYSASTTVPASHIPFIFLYDLLDAPDNPNSLLNVYNGTAPLLDGFTDITLIDRLFGQMDLREYLTEYNAALDTMSPLPELVTAELGAPYDNLRRTTPTTLINISNVNSLSCALLALAMNRQAELERQAGSAVEKLDKDAAAATMSLVGLIPGTQAPLGVIGSAMFAESMALEAQMKLLPHEFIDAQTKFVLSKTTFNEDFTEVGKWTEFNVAASSIGWQLDRLILEQILSKLISKGASKEFANLSAQEKLVAEQVSGVIGGALSQKAAQKFDELAGENEIIDIAPFIWLNINCVDQDYSDVTVISGALKVDEPNKEYEPLEVGTAAMKIETNGAFKEDRTGTSVEIVTNAIAVHIDPLQADADTSQTIDFTVRVENAINTNVAFTLENGGSLVSSDTMKATVKTPGSPWDPPLKLKATSLASTGLRENSTTPAEDEAEIRYQQGTLSISPDGICLPPDSSQTFEVISFGGTVNTVSWETVPPGIGSFSGSGASVTYTAPSTQEGLIQIKATVNGSLSALASVDISDCRCYWTFEAFGSGYTYYETGTWATASTLGGLWVKLYRVENDPPNGLISFIDYNADQPGVYEPAGFSFLDEVEGFAWGYHDSTVAKPQLIITEYQADNFVEGTASGTLSDQINLRPPMYNYINFTLTFRAEFDNATRDACSE